VRVAPRGLDRIAGVHDLGVDGNLVTAQVDPVAMDQLVSALAVAGIVSLVSHPPTLEELFLRHYTDGTS